MAVRIAAVGDVHLWPRSRGRLRSALETLPDQADLLLPARDLTRHGTLGECGITTSGPPTACGPR